MRRLSAAALAFAGLLALTAGKGDTTYQDAIKDALAKAGDKPVLMDFGTLW
ncbi:MAG TPA: hypothetical protein VFP10_05060 [Candidatus Eisenbacteria bacterium]|nr:hypothetical protein [Candidatus Eisenbacteria bacterium]